MTPLHSADAPARRLVFVYNADGGLLNSVRDVWHRARSPQTYPCQLCRLTYGVTGMNGRWREFTESLDVPVVFLHRDEFRFEYASSSWRNVDLPVALLQVGRSLREVVPAQQIRQAQTLKALMRMVRSGLDAAASNT